MKIEKSIVINEKAQKVFDFVKEVSNQKKFGSAFKETQNLSGGELREGSEIMRKVNFMGKQMDAHQRVKVFQPNQKITFETISGPVPVEDSFILEDLGSSTKFTLSLEAKLNGMMKFGASIMKNSIEKQIEGDLLSLKNCLEKPQ